MSFLDQFLKDTSAHHRSSSQQLHHHHQQQQQQGLGFDRSAHRASQDSLGAAAEATKECHQELAERRLLMAAPGGMMDSQIRNMKT